MGLQVLHVLGPELPLAQRREIHRAAITAGTGTGHLYRSGTEVGGAFSVRTNLRLTLEKPDSTEELHRAVINLAGVQVLHVLRPRLPLGQRREVQGTHVATMTCNGHLYRSVYRSRR